LSSAPSIAVDARLIYLTFAPDKGTWPSYLIPSRQVDAGILISMILCRPETPTCRINPHSTRSLQSTLAGRKEWTCIL